MSRLYYSGGDGLENLGLRIFRSMEEYETEASKNGWKDGESFKFSWCVKPVEIEVWVEPKDFAKFENGQPLDIDKVLIKISLATMIHQLGGWQG